MQSLLRWSIENSDPNAPRQPAQQQKLDSEIIDMILGKPDSELMKEALAIAVDEKRDEDERLQALDNFEMLIESIDNANDLVKLKMWEPIHGLLTSSSSEEIKAQVLWIIGTAVQNNPAAQREYLAFSPMHTLLSFLAPGTRSPKTRSKAVYALSGLLKHCVPAVRQLQDADGWKALKDALQDPDITVRRKVAFLLNALLIPTTPLHAPPPPAPTASQSGERSVIVHPDAAVHEAESSATAVHPQLPMRPMIADPSSISTSPLALRALEEDGLLQALLDALTSPVPHGPDGESEGDPDFEAKIVSVLHTYVMSCHGKLSPAQKKAISTYLQAQRDKVANEHELAERWGLSTEEARLFKQTIDRN
ncbi:hypothetical protein NM688_g1371 [Phlebia brevispora]|uniref:Uncharacterized protein n=1 Tax=Phlebia brevispora TaxID=194682 RepID=A0ACC1TBX0_9APHY|nr:hypothetical protein NM688_g1371 [Phlebia brevispora]